jgi:hypothetical protein
VLVRVLIVIEYPSELSAKAIARYLVRPSDRRRRVEYASLAAVAWRAIARHCANEHE